MDDDQKPKPLHGRVRNLKIFSGSIVVLARFGVSHYCDSSYDFLISSISWVVSSYVNTMKRFISCKLHMMFCRFFSSNIISDCLKYERPVAEQARIPWRAIALATVLFVFGTLLLTAGILLLAGQIDVKVCRLAFLLSTLINFHYPLTSHIHKYKDINFTLKFTPKVLLTGKDKSILR